MIHRNWMPKVVTRARMSNSDWWLEMMMYDWPGLILSRLLMCGCTPVMSSIKRAQSLEMENARLPVVLMNAAVIMGMNNTTVAMTAQKPIQMTFAFFTRPFCIARCSCFVCL